MHLHHRLHHLNWQLQHYLLDLDLLQRHQNHMDLENLFQDLLDQSLQHYHHQNNLLDFQ